MNKWEGIERWLKEQSLSGNWEFLKDSAWLEQWLKTFAQTIDAQTRNSESKESDFSIREGKTQLEVTYRLPADAVIEDLLLFVREDCIKLEGLPNDGQKIIRLTSLVRPKHCRASVKDGSLIIRLVKRVKPMKYHLHNITN